jgi:hypothetical protein
LCSLAIGIESYLLLAWFGNTLGRQRLARPQLSRVPLGHEYSGLRWGGETSTSTAMAMAMAMAMAEFRRVNDSDVERWGLACKANIGPMMESNRPRGAALEHKRAPACEREH